MITVLRVVRLCLTDDEALTLFIRGFFGVQKPGRGYKLPPPLTGDLLSLTT